MIIFWDPPHSGVRPNAHGVQEWSENKPECIHPCIPDMQIRSNKCHEISSKYPFFISPSNNIQYITFKLSRQCSLWHTNSASQGLNVEKKKHFSFGPKIAVHFEGFDFWNPKLSGPNDLLGAKANFRPDVARSARWGMGVRASHHDAMPQDRDYIKGYTKSIQRVFCWPWLTSGD